MSNKRKILLVAGDYDVIAPVSAAFVGGRFAVYSAYNHRDAIYTARHERFDVVLVDAEMKNRETGEPTYGVLSAIRGMQNLVLLVVNGNVGETSYPVISPNDSQGLVSLLHDTMALARPGMPETSPSARTEIGLPRRAEEIDTLFALSKSLTEVLDLNEVLQRVVEAARRLTNADEAMLLLPDDTGSELLLRARIGADLEHAQNFRIRTEDTLAGEVFKTGEATLVGAQGPQKVKTEYYVNSLVYVPIRLKGVPIGVLGVNNKEKEDVFDMHHQSLLLNLASFAAIAIENARIHKESLEWAQELESLVEASRVINSSLSLDRALPNICEQLAQLLHVDWSEIYQFNESENVLNSLARYRETIWRFGRGPRIDLHAQKDLKTALDAGKHIWMIPRGPNVNYDEEAVNAVLIVPIGTEQQPMGALYLYFVQPPRGSVSPELIQHVRNLGVQALADILAQPEPNAQNKLRLNSMYRLIRQICRTAEADWCEIASYIDDGNRLCLHASIGTGVWLEPPAPHIDLNANPDILSSLRNQLPINQQINGPSLTSGERTLLHSTRARAVLSVPLFQRGHLQGMVLFADTQTNRLFSEREIDLARAVVGQAAMALENAGLVHDLEQSLEELHRTQDRLVQTARLSAMGELAAVVAHQINNPLTTIIVDAELMLQDETPDSRNFGSLTAIVRAGKRAASVARRLLSIVRSNDTEPLNEVIDVVDTINGVLSLVKTHIEHNRIEILVNVPSAPMPPVRAVRGQLEDIWLNLLLNARDVLVGVDDAQIGLDAQYLTDQGCIEVQVWDNGPGIPDDIQAEIFRPFFTTKPPGEGTGLGLHICKQVVERVGGSMGVESAPGEGTCFTVRLPVAELTETSHNTDDFM